MVPVDSSAWIGGFRKNGKHALDGLPEAYKAQWRSPVRLQVPGGPRLNERKALGFQLSVIPYRQNHAHDWERAISLSRLLRENGLPMPCLDALFATDRHFEKNLTTRLSCSTVPATEVHTTTVKAA